MQLLNIKEEVCPTCKARAVKETQDNQHTNGHWSETRTFKCGCKIAFSPNFMRSAVRYPCPNSPKHNIGERK